MSSIAFARLPGDTATWSFNDPDTAIAIARSSPFIAVDIETGSARTGKRWTIKAFAVSDTQRAVVLDPEKYPDVIRKVLAAGRTLVFHNSFYDVPILYAAGLMRIEDVDRTYCTAVTSRLAWPSDRGGNDLGTVADRVLGGHYSIWKSALETAWKDVTRKSKTAMFDELGLDSPGYLSYAAFDVIVTARVYAALGVAADEAMHIHGSEYADPDVARLIDREQAVNRVLMRRSALGIEVDYGKVDEVMSEMDTIITTNRIVLSRAGIDPDQPLTRIKTDIVGAMDRAGRLPAFWGRKKDGTPSLDKKFLEQMSDPTLDAAIAIAQAERFKKDYGDKVLTYVGADNRIRPQVSVMVAITGRMSYSSPPLQQYPGAVKKIFRFDTPIVSFDWSSIEPVVAAALAKDEAVYGHYEAGDDLYQPIADRAGVPRQTAKIVLLSMLYGASVPKMALQLGIDVEEARVIRRSMEDSMPGIARMARGVKGFGDAKGFVPTISGRPIPLPLDYKTGNRAYMGWKGMNYLIQGSAYDLMAEAIYAIDQAGLGRSVCFAIHDEVVVEEWAADQVEKIMLTPPPDLIRAAGRTPVLRVGRGELGHHWADKG